MFGALKRMFDPKQKLRETLGTQDLPSFPAITTRLLRMLRDPTGDTAEIARVLAMDPGLSQRALKMVNSASFGLRRPATDIGHAVNLLGRGPMESLVLGVAVRSALPNTPVPGFAPAQFWRTSARRAATAKALADLLEPRHRMTSFTAGLLQDMAIPLLANSRSDYSKVLMSCSGVELDAAERDTFGWDHPEVAGWLAVDWEFPQALSQAIVGHHDGEGCPVSVQLVRHLEGDEGMEKVMTEARSRFGSNAESRVAEALAIGAERGDEMAAMFR
ncbi:MAG: HDOD domain-containing protein [Proteobacteria bacterium]|nr:HDOD domain-containing protein [Pseudomonadota bacterium]MCP4918607.1 HDOD domain-containing protein [Pseudomonadota bacterium]